MALKIKRRRSRFHSRAFIAGGIITIVLLGLGVLGVAFTIREADSPKISVNSKKDNGPERPSQFSNAIEQQAVTQLKTFGDWLSANQAKGFIGEVGWPNTATPNGEWNTVADLWYREAFYHDLWITAWASGSWWASYPLSIYGRVADQGDSLNQSNSQAAIVERYKATTNSQRGVNLAGMEFGTNSSDFSNTKPGVAGVDYFYEPAASYEYLAKQNVALVRLPFRWERVQPALGGPLAPAEVEAITKQLDAAHANGIKVVLDLHNYGAYQTTEDMYLLGDGKLTQQHLIDVWQKLSQSFKAHPAIAGYGIMNEPHDLPNGGFGSPAKNWEAASQAALNALRNNGDDTLLMIAGYDWSSLARWQKNHPAGWITDPANNFRYEAHHYWDSDGSGTYTIPFAEELQQR